MKDQAQREKDRLVADATKEGFCEVRVTQPDRIPLAPPRLGAFVKKSHHGTMAWMEERQEWRGNPAALWPEAKSVIMLMMNYGPDHNPLDVLAKKDKAAISVYAKHRDYHDIIKGKLKQIAGRLAARTKEDVKVFVDTAPVMEKPLAASAGLGWQGKHTNLVSRRHGSWTFLGSIFTTAELPPDEEEIDHCGSCQSCLDICPTDAFPAPYQLDARRCISYLTIEHKGPIDRELRTAMGNRIYGCDDCLAACPWNKFAEEAQEAKLQARNDLRAPSLLDLLQLDDTAFRKHFSGSPIKRIGRDKFISNVLIALGNSEDTANIAPIRPFISEEPPLVRAMAVWALSRLCTASDWQQIKSTAMSSEGEPLVLEEWNAR